MKPLNQKILRKFKKMLLELAIRLREAIQKNTKYYTLSEAPMTPHPLPKFGHFDTKNFEHTKLISDIILIYKNISIVLLVVVVS